MTRGPGLAGLTLVIRELCSWAPVWIPLVLVAQIGIRGLRPALAEQRRLERAETGLELRHDQALEESTELDRLLRAQDDPIYQERERRRWQEASTQAAGEAAAARSASGIPARRDEDHDEPRDEDQR